MYVEVGVVKAGVKGVIDHRYVAKHAAGLVIESISYDIKMCGSVGGVVWLSDVFRF